MEAMARQPDAGAQIAPLRVRWRTIAHFFAGPFPDPARNGLRPLMRHRVLAALSLLLLALSATIHSGSFVAAAKGQEASVEQSGVSRDLDSLLRDGQRLQLEGRWGDALSLYEDARRNYPNEAEVERGYRFSRIHFDLGRRYADGSFRQALTAVSERDALALYAEVLLMVQSHHVDEPNWRGLFDSGTTSLEVALREPAFTERHLRGVAPERVSAFVRGLRRDLARQPVRSRQETRDAVALVARWSREALGAPGTAVIFEYACGAASSLDEYSSFLTADQLKEVYSQIEGNFVGLGVELKANEGALLIVKVITGSPAARGGLRAGDQIVAVDGQLTQELATEEAANLLQGPEQSTVDVTVISPEQAPRIIRLRRERVEVPSIDEVKIIDAQQGIGYLKLTCFEKTTSKDLDAALWDLHRQGMRSLIMDLRGNPGGLLTSSVEVADKFVEQGTLVSTRGRTVGEDYTYSAQRSGTWKMPLVVLIDGDSASASEIFAGAIRDHRRGTIVGARSYGKGSVQGIFSLNVGQTGLRLTTSKFYSPHGHPFSRVGVSPDVVVRQAARPVDGELPMATPAPTDPFVDAGLEVARQQLARR
jgi:carboxyl-terminal processing protease